MASSLREVTLDAFQAGAATAAKALGYAGLASIILSDHLGPEAIARLFRLSVSKHAAQDLVVILSAGSIARYKAHPNGWDGEIDVLDEATIRGRHVVPIFGINMLLEIDRAKGRVTETIGGKEPTYYNCESPSSKL
jgi:hypothetical protein